MCKNLIVSARLVGIDDDDFIVACIDKLAFKTMSEFHNNTYLFVDQDLTEYQNYSQNIEDKFRSIVLSIKLNIIEQNHSKYGNICFTDSDIIFRKDPRNYFDNQKTLLQQESPHNAACTGFMVFNNDIYSKSFIHTVLSHIDSFKNRIGTDQELINYLLHSSIIPRNNYEYLDKNLFLNGMCFHDGRSIENAVIVHNNCIIGIDNKINRFKHYNLWYL